MGQAWNADDIPSQDGRVAVVTGASSGLGLATVKALAGHGARVVMAVRDVAAGEGARRAIRDQQPTANLRVERLDLASLSSVRDFASVLQSSEPHLDLLINNAGVMRTPPRRTEDDFELQLGVNFLGPFALTGRLLPMLTSVPGARVVTVSSTEHKPGQVNFDDLQLDRSYDPRKAYQQSKLAATAFALELDHRLRSVNSPLISVLAHPGVSVTNRATKGPVGLTHLLVDLASRVLGQPAEQGVLPQLYAATAPGVRGGQFFGPAGRREMRGHVTTVSASERARVSELGQRLWQIAEKLTGVTFTPPYRTRMVPDEGAP